jgi:hypothetical protein
MYSSSWKIVKPQETFLCSTFALQLKTVLLLDVLQLLLLSAGTLISLQDIMFHLNTFYCKQDTTYMLSIYLIICVAYIILFYYYYFFRSIILCLVILLVETGIFISSYKHFIFIIIILFVLYL